MESVSYRLPTHIRNVLFDDPLFQNQSIDQKSFLRDAVQQWVNGTHNFYLVSFKL